MNNSNPKEMLILAGGFGTRLREAVSSVAKPMAPINGRPFLEYLMDYWIEQGIYRFILSIGYLGDNVKNHFGERYQSASIEYVHEATPLGTGGALQLALRDISWSGKCALLINGDTWFPVDLELMMKHALKQNKPLTVALKTMEHSDRYSRVLVDIDGTIKKFNIKNDDHALINAGCYLFNVEEIRNALTEYSSEFSLENDFLVDYATSGNVGSSIQDHPFLDIGIPEDYWRASEYLG